jgi:hypothetical protein
MARKKGKARGGKLRRDGDCFEVAANLALQLSGEARVVHGLCTGRGPIEGRPFVHAWVELNGLALDMSNGLQVAMPVARYRKLARLRGKVIAYTPAQIRAEMVRCKHYGPWDVKLAAAETDS